MEQRRIFTKSDLTYLANLCHNCGECLYACQYAPPHEFGIDVPKTLAQIRVQSYEESCSPHALHVAFRRSGVTTAIALVLGFATLMIVASTAGGTRLWATGEQADFYGVVPYPVMTTLFGGVALFVLAALSTGARRLSQTIDGRVQNAGLVTRAHAVRDALTLRHLHSTGVDCTTGEEQRHPWRRWCHHATFYGFALCFASTTVAAIYHNVLGETAPYAYLSLPVVLGTIGGVGLLVGPAGLFVIKRRSDPALIDSASGGLDEAFAVLLFLTSATGLALLAFRHQQWMGILLVVHLATVLALFITLPYGKFVHGIYRVIALRKFHTERVQGRSA
jgi:citrate/tricarballylate utilization protein